MRPLDAALAVAGCTLWGLGFTVGKATIESCPPIFLMALRYGLAGIALVWLAPRPPRQLARVLAFSLIGVVIADSLLFVGMREVTVSTSVLILQLAAPFATLIAAIMLGERLGGRKAAGTVLAFVGVALVVGQPGGGEPILPVLLIVAGALAWAAGQVMAKTITDTDTQTLVAWAAIFAVPPLLLSSLLLESGHLEVFTEAGWSTVIGILYMGLVMTALGYMVWFRLLRRYPVGTIMPFALLVPVASMVGGAVFLGEALTLLAAGGAVLVICGLWLVARADGAGRNVIAERRPAADTRGLARDHITGPADR